MSGSRSAEVRSINRLLKMAVVGGVEIAVRLHIDRGDDLDSCDDRGFTPLMLAAAQNRTAICQLLINAGVDLFALDPSGRDALAIATAAGALDAARTIQVAQTLKDARDSQAALSVQHDGASGHHGTDRLDERMREVKGNARGGSERYSAEADFSADAAERRSEEPLAPQCSLAQGTPGSAGLTAGASAACRDFVEPLCIDEEDSQGLDPSGWEADEACPPPPDDALLATTQAAIQEVITGHAPIDDSVDWAHFEAFLPDHAAPLPRAKDAESTAELRRLILRALREGSVPEFDAENLCIGTEGAVDTTSMSLLRFVLNDLGAETDERFEYSLPHEDFDVFVNSAETQDEEEVVDDAIAFLADLESRRNDPMRHYMRDAQRRSLITAEEEIALAKAMEDASNQAIDVLASWPSGIRLALRAIEMARSGRRPLNSITTGPRDEIEPDPSEFVEVADMDSTMLVAFPGVEREEESGAETSEDVVAAQEQGEAMEPLPVGFFERASELYALVSSGPAYAANAADARSALAALSLKRTFLLELAATAIVDKSEQSARFLAAVRALSIARDRMAGANLRLVLSIAKRYLYSGLPMDDLVQEGNIGLLKAVDKFDWRRGYKFSTMATWWIRQQVSRSAADDARTIRLPVHMHEKLQRVEREAEALSMANGRAPSSAELAERLAMLPRKVEALLQSGAAPLSIDEMDAEGLRPFDSIEDKSVADPFEAIAAKELRETLVSMLSKLDDKPEQVMRMRFGLADGGADPCTLEEVGVQFELTRERIRQIEAKALRRLGQQNNRRLLRGWVSDEDPKKTNHEASAESEQCSSNEETEIEDASVSAKRAPAAPVVRPSDERGDTQELSSLDRLLALATELGIPVDDDRSGPMRSTWVNLVKPRNRDERGIVRKLIAAGFEFWPGKGYWR